MEHMILELSKPCLLVHYSDGPMEESLFELGGVHALSDTRWAIRRLCVDIWLLKQIWQEMATK